MSRNLAGVLLLLLISLAGSVYLAIAAYADQNVNLGILSGLLLGLTLCGAPRVIMLARQAGD